MKNIIKRIPAIIICAVLLLLACGQQTSNLTPEEKFAQILKNAKAGDLKAELEVGIAYNEGVGVDKDFKAAAEWFQKAADRDSAKAHQLLGLAYESGRGVEKNSKVACEHFQKSSDLGDEIGSVDLGQCYYFETVGWPKDHKKAVELWSGAAQKGLPRAMLFLGLSYFDGPGAKEKDKALGLQWVEKAALSNPEGKNKLENEFIADAQYFLAEFYVKGDGTKKDAVKAYEYYLKAAENGNVESQRAVAFAYYAGSSLPKDAEKAIYWFEKAATAGDLRSQAMLGYLYWVGIGAGTDRVLAYAWSNIASAKGDKTAIQNRDIYEKQISHADRSEAQRLSSAWIVGKALKRDYENNESASIKKDANSKLNKVSTGTAFIASQDGYAITNQHVVDSCTEIKSEGVNGLITVKTEDKANDIALIKIPGKFNFFAKIGSEEKFVRQGEEIIVFGYPLNSILSSGGNLTPGVVSALSGLQNNTNQIQITAPIQPGSSGSPVLNKKAEVVAVVTSKLSDSKMMRATGQVSQNVNFAISGQTLKNFLDTHSVKYVTGGFFSFAKSSVDIADEARKWTVIVECWK